MLNLKVVVVSNPILVQALVDRRNDLPKSPEIYDSVDEVRGKKAPARRGIAFAKCPPWPGGSSAMQSAD